MYVYLFSKSFLVLNFFPLSYSARPTRFQYTQSQNNILHYINENVNIQFKYLPDQNKKISHTHNEKIRFLIPQTSIKTHIIFTKWKIPQHSDRSISIDKVQKQKRTFFSWPHLNINRFIIEHFCKIKIEKQATNFFYPKIGSFLK